MSSENTPANGVKVAREFDLEAFQIRMMELCDEEGYDYDDEKEACHKVADSDSVLFSRIRAEFGVEVEVSEVKLTVNTKTGTTICSNEQ